MATPGRRRSTMPSAAEACRTLGPAGCLCCPPPCCPRRGSRAWSCWPRATSPARGWAMRRSRRAWSPRRRSLRSPRVCCPPWWLGLPQSCCGPPAPRSSPPTWPRHPASSGRSCPSSWPMSLGPLRIGGSVARPARRRRSAMRLAPTACAPKRCRLRRGSSASRAPCASRCGSRPSIGTRTPRWSTKATVGTRWCSPAARAAGLGTASAFGWPCPRRCRRRTRPWPASCGALTIRTERRPREWRWTRADREIATQAPPRASPHWSSAFAADGARTPCTASTLCRPSSSPRRSAGNFKNRSVCRTCCVAPSSPSWPRRWTHAPAARRPSPPSGRDARRSPGGSGSAAWARGRAPSIGWSAGRTAAGTWT
mmetsp:Transcript_16708/g.47370  ORF Transcript_16708/g.47370 Transcript_16708/m.47370 type:complete len:368 (+) Transcript_16708:1533-2636(+)